MEKNTSVWKLSLFDRNSLYIYNYVQIIYSKNSHLKLHLFTNDSYQLLETT